MGQLEHAARLAQALEALEAAELRELLRSALSALDERERTRLLDRLLALAARNEGRTGPVGFDEVAVAEAERFARSAEREHYADPRDVDRHLLRGNEAYLRRDYRAARQIFHALLPPIACVDIDLGQRGMVDDVLAVDIELCALRYIVACYMTAAPEERPEAVLAAILATGDLALLWNPISEMDFAAVEPLPGFDEFLVEWRALVEEVVVAQRAELGNEHPEWDSDADRWLREVVECLEGADGLLARARATGNAEDYRAWCRAIVDDGDWNAALVAFQESAAAVSRDSYWHIAFLDGAALAAQELGREDLPLWLERAWRAVPSWERLSSWLGAAGSAESMLEVAATAMAACPRADASQRAILHLVAGDVADAAQCLAQASGLGWSSPEHPGPVVFPLFAKLLSGDERVQSVTPALVAHLGRDDLEALTAEAQEPRLAQPELVALLKAAGLELPMRGEARAELLAALRTAAEKRVEGVTKKKRRKHYEHAAVLVAACAAIDPTPEGDRWVAELRSRYSRYPALQGEFNAYLGTLDHGRKR